MSLHIRTKRLPCHQASTFALQTWSGKEEQGKCAPDDDDVNALMPRLQARQREAVHQVCVRVQPLAHLQSYTHINMGLNL